MFLATVPELISFTYSHDFLILIYTFELFLLYIDPRLAMLVIVSGCFSSNNFIPVLITCTSSNGVLIQEHASSLYLIYQGNYTNILFISSRAILRTAFLAAMLNYFQLEHKYFPRSLCTSKSCRK